MRSVDAQKHVAMPSAAALELVGMTAQPVRQIGAGATSRFAMLFCNTSGNPAAVPTVDWLVINR